MKNIEHIFIFRKLNKAVLLICMMAGFLLLSFMQPVRAGEPAAATLTPAAPMLIQSTISLEQGEEYVLKTGKQSGNEPVWSSSDDSIVTVTGGVINAKKAGFAKITVSSAADPSLFSECMVVVKPGRVTGVQQTKAKSRKLKLAWKEVKNCGGYRIYYRRKGEKEYRLAKTSSAAAAALKGLAPETGYDIRVAAYVDTPSGKTDGISSEKIRLFTAPEINSKTRITNITRGRLSFYRGQKIRFFTIRWKEAKDANSYQIYTQVGSKKPKLIATAKKPKATLYAATGYSYRIYVVPCRTKHGITAKGQKSAAVTILSN